MAYPRQRVDSKQPWLPAGCRIPRWRLAYGPILVHLLLFPSSPGFAGTDPPFGMWYMGAWKKLPWVCVWKGENKLTLPYLYAWVKLLEIKHCRCLVNKYWLEWMNEWPSFPGGILPSYHLCPSICPSVGLSVIFSAQPTQIPCGMRQATQAYISINNKISIWAGNCFLLCLPESPDFSPTGNLSINEEAHRSHQKVFPAPLSYLGLTGPRDGPCSHYFPYETWCSSMPMASLHCK